MPTQPRLFDPIIRLSLAEDAARHDATSLAVIPKQSRITAVIVAKDAGVLAGGRLAGRVFALQDPSLRVRILKHDAAHVKPGDRLLRIEGRARSIFAAERTALNFLGHLSGIATLTRAYVEKVKGTGAAILDTRKTIPGLRRLEKYAVTAGGGKNHRMDLKEQILIKSNHLRVIAKEQGKPNAVRLALLRAKAKYPKRFIAIEVVGMKELAEALQLHPSMILLDNWKLSRISGAVKSRNARSRRTLLEVSGGVTLANVRAIAITGINRISIGRLTDSSPRLDTSLRIET